MTQNLLQEIPSCMRPGRGDNHLLCPGTLFTFSNRRQYGPYFCENPGLDLPFHPIPHVCIETSDGSGYIRIYRQPLLFEVCDEVLVMIPGVD